MTITAATHAASHELDAAGANAKLAEAAIATISRADAELATESRVGGYR